MKKSKKSIFRPLWVILVVFWSVGPVQSAFAGTYNGGSGTEADPYRISTPQNMNEIGTHIGDWDKHFVLTNNIDLSAYTGTQFNIIGTYDNAFTGAFDGNGHTISNFTYKTSGVNYTGLFGYVHDANALIKDLHLTDPDVDVGSSWIVGAIVGCLQSGTITACSVTGGSVTGDNNTGGLVGRNDSGGTISNCYAAGTVSGKIISTGGLVGRNYYGTISNCYATGNVAGGRDTSGLSGSNYRGTISNCYAAGSVTGHDGYTGGLVGHNYEGTISNCYALASVVGMVRDYTGGLVGYGENSTITNCYATGSVTGGGWYTGGLVGANNGGTISNCYATGSVSEGEYFTGGLVGSGFTSAVNYCFWDVNTTGQSGSAGGEGKTTVEMMTKSTFTDAGWDFIGETANGTSQIWQMPTGGGYPVLSGFHGYLPPELSGDGTPNQPYLIGDSNELGAIYHYDSSANYRLQADIDLSGISWSTALIPVFHGCFDGNDYTIAGLHVEVGGHLGLFGYVSIGAVIKDLTLVDPNVNAAGNSDYVGSLVGYMLSATITNCGIHGGSVSGRQYTGGLVGYNLRGTISNCHSSDSVMGNSFTGGLVGRNYKGKISNCYATGNVAGGRNTGGLAGNDYRGTISNCYATGSVTGDSYTGGLVGRNDGTVNTSFWDVNSSNMDTSAGGEPKTTAQMQTITTFTGAGWDFVGEQVNGREYIWRMCVDGLDYPKLTWQFMLADFVCPDGVEINDLDVLVQQWLMEKLSADVAPSSGDGVVDFADWAVLADGWQNTIDLNDVAVFADQWLRFGAYCADIAPTPAGDGMVDMLDFAVLAEHWLMGK